MDLTKLTIREAHEGLKRGDFTVRDLVAAYETTIGAKDVDLNAYREVFADLDAQAATAQQKFADGTATLLTGIPIAVKDNIVVKGRKAGASSKILEGYVAPYTATAVQKLLDAGAVLIGRTNMDEFAMGASTENSAYGVTKNPHDTARVAGGSSGGSAAVVAANMALAALGSDTGGSIREPAGFCGVVGLKPTHGAVSRHGLMAMASSFDVIGPLTKNVDDAEIIFNAIRGIDPLDSTTVESATDTPATGARTIGVPADFLKEGIDPDVLANFNAALDKLRAAGYTIKDISIPLIEKSLAVYYVLIPAEVSSNMARYDGVRFGGKVEGTDLLDDYMQTRGSLIGAEVKRRIIIGTYVLSAGYADQYYNKATQVRALIRSNIAKVFEDVDLIAMPIAPTPAFKIGENAADPLQMYLNDIFTVAANVAGVPAISIPAGTVDRDGCALPTGLQLMAPHLHEQRLFEVGKKFETIG